MKLKKLLPQLVEGIVESKYDIEPKEIQSTCVPIIKSGSDLMVIAEKGTGKSSTIAIGVIQQLKEKVEEAPRAIIISTTKDEAFKLEEEINKLGKHTSLRTFVAFDKGDFNYQKDMIYDGLDILIATPKRLLELLNNTGVPLIKLKMLVIDDTELMFTGQNHTIIHRITDAIEKIQVLVFANKKHSKFEDLMDRSMKNPYFIQK